MLNNLLPLLIGVPIIAGVLCLALSDRFKFIIKALAFMVTGSSLAGAVYIFLKKPLSWQAGAYTVFTADNLSAFIGMGIAAFAFLVSIYSSGSVKDSFGRSFGYISITLGSSLGTVFAGDFLALLVFWGALAVMLYLLVNLEGTSRAAASAKKALIMIGGTDALMLFGIALIWAVSGTFSMDKARIAFNGPLPYIAYFAMASACFAKAGAMPFHSWLPDVAEDGPASVSAYLPASVDKLLSIYLLTRLSLNIFAMNRITNTFLLLIGAVTIIFAVTMALIQHDLKRLLGYHAVSQVGYMVLGIGTASAVGIAGALFHMLNNAVYKSCLFLAGGSVEKRRLTSDLDSLGGLAKYMPVTFAAFLIASLSISGVPPFNGFVSKWMIYQGIIESAGKNPLWIVWLVAAMFGSALTVASFMKLVHAIFLGRPSAGSEGTKEAPFSMSFPVVVLAIVCFIFGVFAFAIPIRLFIAPSIAKSITYLGIWDPAAATLLIIIGIAAGLLIYILMKKAKFRVSPTFVGGEDPDKFERIPGTDFYNTIKDAKGLSAIYKKEEEKVLDIYNVSERFIRFFTRLFQYLHNGILPTYMVWCLLGMIAVFLALFFR